MKKMFSFHARKAGNAIASFALLAGFAAFVVLVASPSVPGDTLGAQAGGGRPGSDPTVPAVPTLGSATPGDGQVTLEWEAPRSNGGAAITKYLIDYTDASRRTTTIDTRSVATTFTVTGLTNDIEYGFEIIAVNSVGQSSPSNSVSATPAAPKSAVPGAPVLNSATAGDGEITIAWSAPADDGGDRITNYVISHTPDRGAEILIDAGDVTSYTISRLANDVLQTIKVAAENTAGVGTYSNELTATPEASASVPGVPTDLSARGGNQSVSVSWLAPRDTGGSDITNYVVSYTPRGGSEVLVDVGTDTTYTITSLVNGTEYNVKVLAENNEGSGVYTTSVLATPSTVPGIPQNLSIIPGDQTLAVSWEAPLSDGGLPITQYILGFTSGDREETVTIERAATSYSLERLENNTSYEIRVRAVNDNGEGEFTNIVSGTPAVGTLPTIVGTPTVTPSERSVIVTWSTNINTSTRVDFGLLNITSATRELNRDTRVVNHTVTIDNLVPCTTYSYKVRSFDALSREAVSSEQEFTTLGCIASVEEVKRGVVDARQGAEIDFRRQSQEVRTKLTVPANVKAGETDVVFQVKKLEKEETKQEIGKPDNRVEWLGEHVYNLTAYGSESEEVNDFDNPITVTIEYGREDIQGIDLNTLTIHHFEEGLGWRVLSNCVNNYNPTTGVGEISCQTDSFSIFGLFGENAVGSSSSSSGTFISTSTSVVVSSSNRDVYTEKDTVKDMNDVSDNTIQDVKVTPSNLNLPQFTQDLRIGLNNNLDVFNLQKFLNAQGFILANEGPGSPGRETSYFGPRTQNALKRFQETYSDAMFEMFGARPQTLGVFGEWTRKFIEMQFRQEVE